MSKFACKCGNTISDVQCPNECTGVILSDKSEDKFLQEVGDIIEGFLACRARGELDEWRIKYFHEAYPKDLPGSTMIHDALFQKYLGLILRTLECDRCGRLWIQRGVGENCYREYLPAAQDGVKVLGFNQFT